MQRRTFTWVDDMVYAAICFGAGAWIYTELLSLQNGEVQSIKLWAPLAFLYNHLGFYPAVLVLPLLGVCMVISALRKKFRPASAIKDVAQ